MQNLGLEKYGITSWKEIFYNLSYEELYDHEMDPSLTGFDKGYLTKSGSVSVDTGKFTGRSPKDKYFVRDETSEENIWWAEEGNGSDNRPLTPAAWDHLQELAQEQLNGKKLYVVDSFCGANEDTRIKIRLVTEVAWMAHFAKNMFIRPTEEELKNFEPDWTILNACKTSNKDFEKDGMRSETFAAFNIAKRMTLIGGTWYGGEIKKGMFSMMNYFLPLKGIGAFHCSANMGKEGDTAIFFGLSGTGKTTLSTDPDRALIGDDEHGWDDNGIFNFEGGCYAKTINLSVEKEPDIYHAIKRNALLENLVLDGEGNIDFASKEKTENTRVSYPIYHIENIVKPESKGNHANKIIFLTCDAFGVLPPVSVLTKEQAMYHFLSGYTAKVAGTELGVTEPTAAFSSCFGQAFLTLHPTKYADVLGEKMDKHGSKAYLVNTGWSGGGYGTGSRIDITCTRRIITAILDGSIEKCEMTTFPMFNMQRPVAVPGIDTKILNPRNWNDNNKYDETLNKLANMFTNNFKKFTDTEKGKALVAAGPQL